MEEPDVPRVWIQAGKVFSTGLNFALLIGITIVPFGGVELGTAIICACVVLLFLAHLALGIYGYRRTMRRPWPKVAPLPDDDDDWY